MTDWLILTDTLKDVGQGDTPHKVMRVVDYLSSPQLFTGRRPYVLNLSRSLSYQSKGYFASLLAEARGHRVSPSVQTMVELSAKGLYAHALPELNETLKGALDKGARPVDRLLVAFSRTPIPGYETLAREVSDWFRAPALEIRFDTKTEPEIARIKIVSPQSLDEAEHAFFLQAMNTYTRGNAPRARSRTPAKWSLAILVDPNEATPPSAAKSLRRLITVAEKMGVDAELIEPSDFTSLAEFDALFIRATTAIDNYTYRFARRAEQEGMPVIDDTMSMIRCTNKVYLKETLERAGLPIPRTEVIDEKTQLDGVLERLGTPVVVKTPDGSFGTNMVKAKTLDELKSGAKTLFEDTALLLAQAFVPTKFDWRIGVLDGQPLYACQYFMARGHWQIINHTADGKMQEGNFACLPVSEVNPEVIDVAVRAARLMGNGLYGVDLKETDTGVVIMEINDNPNLETDVEAKVIGDELWRSLIRWFETRLEVRMGRRL